MKHLKKLFEAGVGSLMLALLLLIFTAAAVIDLTPRKKDGTFDEKKGRTNLFVAILIIGFVNYLAIEYISDFIFKGTFKAASSSKTKKEAKDDLSEL